MQRVIIIKSIGNKNTPVKYRKFLLALCVTIILVFFISSLDSVFAQPNIPIPNINIGLDEAQSPQEVTSSLQLLLLLTILAIAPSILIMMTSFTRIIIVLSFIRNAIATQQTPPTQVLIGLALFLTFFVMSPVAANINENALQPYLNEEISQEVALTTAMEPVREFMFRQTREQDLALFIEVGNINVGSSLDDVPTTVLIPAFVISELKTAFQIGFILFIPFLIIDMVVASTLMSMGMMMLPPAMISLPFKLLLFVMVDGWNIIIRSLVLGFK